MIEVIGRPRGMCRNEAKFAAGFFAAYLMNEKLARKIDIEITFESLGSLAEGYCHTESFGKNPREFQISVSSKVPRYKALQILAHEMVHVKQYAQNELSTDSANAFFMGKVFRLDNSFESYVNYPWEIEAFGREKGLYILYQVLLKQEKIKFRNGKMYMNGKYVKLDKMKG